MNKLSKAEEQALREALQVRQTASSEGWVKVLKPWLESKIHNSWLDPKGASNTDEFFYQYTVAHGFAQAAQQVIEYVEQNLATAESLTNKQEGIVTEKKFNVGGD